MADYRLALGPDELDAMVADCSRPELPFIGFDTETTGLNRWRDTVVGYSLAPEWGRAYYVPIAHTNGPNADTAYAQDALRRVLSVKGVVCHGAAFDAAIGGRWLGWQPYWLDIAHCTLVMAQCLGERSEAGKDTAGGLKPLAKHYMGIERPDFDSFFPPKTKDKDKIFANVDVDLAVPYGAADADDVLGLVSKFLPLLERAQLMPTYTLEVAGRLATDDWEHRGQGNFLHEILWMESRGACLDKAYADECADKCRAFADQIQTAVLARLEARLGRQLTNPKKPDKPQPFNPNSPEQLAAILFDPAPAGLGLPVLKKTPPSKKFPDGNRSTDEAVLERLAAHEPALAWLLEQRAALKAVGTYFEPVPNEFGHDEDGLLILHPNYKTYGTETGRTSSAEPNVQNQPKEQTFGLWHDGAWKGQPMVEGIDPITVNARDMIRARPGYYLVDMDWSQIEYRIIAGMSGDPGLLDTFDRGVDLHVATYALMNGVPIEAVGKPQRAEGKTMNYALNFGAGVQRIAGMLGVAIDIAKTNIAKWKQAFPMVALWKEQVEEFAKRHHYVETPLGRKRWLVFNTADNDVARKAYFAALREAVNMPVQGFAADLLKLCLTRLGPWLRTYMPAVHTILETHDSITFEVPNEIPPDYFVSAVRPVVEFAKGFIDGYPAIPADFGVGQSWGSLQEEKERAEEAAALAQRALTPNVPSEIAQTPAMLIPPGLGIHPAEQPPVTVDLHLGEPLTEDKAKALSELVAAMRGTNVLCLHLPNDEASVDIPNVGFTGHDGHLFAHIFERFTLGPRGEVLAHLIGGATA